MHLSKCAIASLISTKTFIKYIMATPQQSLIYKNKKRCLALAISSFNNLVIRLLVFCFSVRKMWCLIVTLCSILDSKARGLGKKDITVVVKHEHKV